MYITVTKPICGHDSCKKHFRVIKEYPTYYLCEYIEDNGKPLYKECISKFEVGEIKEAVKVERENISRIYTRGRIR